MIDIAPVIDSTAYAVLRRNRNYVEFDDLRQEAWLWVLDHPKKMTEFQEEDDALGAWLLNRDLYKHLDKLARKVRADRVGYLPEDERFYTLKSIEELLPYVLNNDMTPPAGNVTGKSTKDPAEGGDWLASWIDVKRAWERADLTDRQRGIVISLLGDSQTQQAVATCLYTTQSSVSASLQDALRKLLTFLGGDRPRGCPYDCECHEGRLRKRPGKWENAGVL